MTDRANRTRRFLGVVLLLLGFFSAFGAAHGRDEAAVLDAVYKTEPENIVQPIPNGLPKDKTSVFEPADKRQNPQKTSTSALEDLHSAVQVMQDRYFSLGLGKWTDAIDWTAAVMNTHLTATLSTLSHSLHYMFPGTFDRTHATDVEAQLVENEINKYFSQSITYYFGEDYFAVRNEAFDDMLWVVLEWLDSITFIGEHSRLHYASSWVGKGEWHGKQFIPVFAHRARIFYELAEQGWDWHLCGGGMTWNPRLLPYKNAITNELFISASANMYLHFPGDNNSSPFVGAHDNSSRPNLQNLSAPEVGAQAASTYNPVYLANAINGYNWLKKSGMTNTQGLYVDGFHIKGYEQNKSKTECDERNEMVYTYNQGVVLSGLRGLWESTGNVSYLEDGHELVRNVIRATGWTDTDLSSPRSFSESRKRDGSSRTGNRNLRARYTNTTQPPTMSPTWSGLGSHGILTELCDPLGTCNQDGQTFKGIYFHHLTAFCGPLPVVPARPGKTHAANRFVANLHRRSCAEYTAWVVRNAQAALSTRDEEGRFGAWWGAGEWEDDVGAFRRGFESLLRQGAVDYRNDPLHGFAAGRGGGEGTEFRAMTFSRKAANAKDDPNDRGRGRTVETQGSGVAVTRAMWEFLRNYGDEARL